MGDINQDDIDKLLQDALGEEKESCPLPIPDLKESGVATQDDIDALFASVAGEEPAGKAESPPEPPSATTPPPAGETAGQDDIDALFASAVSGGGPAGKAASPSESPPAAGKTTGRDDLDALMAAVDAATESSLDAKIPDESEEEPTTLISPAAASGDSAAAEPVFRGGGEKAAVPPESPAAPDSDPDEIDSAAADLDLDEIMKEVAAAAPPPPVKPAAQVPPPAPVPDPKPSPPPPPVAAAPPPPRREFTVLSGAGEAASLANQAASLLNSLSEKADGYLRAWAAADGEAKELRSRALAEERRRISLESEKSALVRELEDIRRQLGEAEGTKLAGEESRRVLESSLQSKIRGLEGRLSLADSEGAALKEELVRVRNQATGIDLENRRVRFEAERLRNEAESERMERLRIQRALENREKELQALQAQTAGQASSLFIDELHRLVRRLETELEARTSGAHEALLQLDRLEASGDMVPVTANLRAALLRAAGADGEADDALRSLGREAAGIRGAAALAPGKPEITSFEAALATYNFADAIEAAGALLREARATPSLLMRKIYQCPALRRPEAGDRLPDLTRLLEGLRTVQEANDRARGSESGESEVFHVRMFDFLHNLVRLKIVNRLSGDIWRLFLDLRGRFSFVTSDRQWAEYRDNTLGNREAKG
ncbi:MAG: hypothetical protein LBU64_00135 [Planctomycetota bacterium]|jgi:hypothetical protein|nr:hypothetical protein [Planctomycetota bacterium]